MAEFIQRFLSSNRGARKVIPDPNAKYYGVELAAMVEALMYRASTSGERGLLVGLIAPHAGYTYSGPVAASVFARVFERVLLIGPSHYERVDGIAAPSSQTFATPLGRD